MFISKEMEFMQLVVHQDCAVRVFDQLGSLDMAHFVDYDDQKTHFNRPYTSQIKKIDESLGKIKVIKDEIAIQQEIRPYELLEPQKLFQNQRKQQKLAQQSIHSHFLVQVDKLDKFYNVVAQDQQNLKKCEEERNSLIYQKEVFQLYLRLQRNKQARVSSELSAGVGFVDIVGIIDTHKLQSFKRLVFRCTKGNFIMITQEVNHQINQYQLANPRQQTHNMSMFQIIIQNSNIMNAKIFKLIEAFQVVHYNFADVVHKSEAFIQNLNSDIQKLEDYINILRNQIQQFCIQMVEGSENCFEIPFIEELQIYFLKQRCLYEVLNMCEINDKFYKAYLWLVKDDRKKLMIKLQELKDEDESIAYEIMSNEGYGQNPPTYIKTNAFTELFQEIVNTYGVPRYREVNPGLFAIILFPFLFGVMYGDMFHGGILLALSVYLCLMPIQKGRSILYPLYPYRYLLLMMALFSFYSGLLYNDCSSLTFNLFGSCYQQTKKGHIHMKFNTKSKIIRKKECVYPFGLDPIWVVAQNSLAFQNSYKMKMAVIIGISEMSLGIVLRGMNNIKDKAIIDFFCEFLPMLVLLSAAFGYMVLLIILKWLTNWTSNSAFAPSIINQMINIPLSNGQVSGSPLILSSTFQQTLQQYILLLVLLCVFIILVPKPLYYYLQLRNSRKTKSVNYIQLNEDSILDDSENHFMKKGKQDHNQKNKGITEHEFNELVVHQVIETIEFVLGSISNTASYLRLWALSLAHSQLSQVFFRKCLKAALLSGNSFLIVIAFFVFMNITICVLLMMDCMECFLHSLRLQWVEFQNKFYKADGYKYKPFSYSNAVKEYEE